MFSNSFSLKSAVVLAILFISLYFSLQIAVLSTPPVSINPETFPEVIVKYDPVHLESEFERMLGQVKRGKAISHEQVSRLKEIKRYLQLLNVTPALLARLNQLIDEILALNDELIYPPDGNWHTDQEGGSNH